MWGSSSRWNQNIKGSYLKSPGNNKPINRKDYALGTDLPQIFLVLPQGNAATTNPVRDNWRRQPQDIDIET
jgi:hypothetical protein